jgi:hypothetical protein
VTTFNLLSFGLWPPAAQVDLRLQHYACGVFGMLLALYLVVAVLTFKTALDKRKDPPVSVTRIERVWSLPNLVRIVPCVRLE